MDLNKWLNQVEDTAVQGLEEAGKNGLNEGFEDGPYIGIITKHELRESNAGKPGVMVILTILESEDPSKIGENYLVWNDLEREDAFKFFGWWLKSIKIDVSDPSDVIAEFRRNKEDLFDVAKNKTVVKFNLLTTTAKSSGNEYQNLKIKSVVEDYDFSNVSLPEPDEKKSGDDSGSGEGTPGSDEGEGGDDTVRVGMNITFNVEEGKGKNKTVTEKTGEVVELDNENETLKVKLEDGSILEIEGNDVTGIAEESAVE